MPVLAAEAGTIFIAMMKDKGWPLRGERWTSAQLDELQCELNRNHLVSPIFAAASDAIGSLRFDLVDAGISNR